MNQGMPQLGKINPAESRARYKIQMRAGSEARIMLSTLVTNDPNRMM